MTQNDAIGMTRGLYQEEGLLYDKPQSDHPGVDLPSLKGLPSQIGLPEREKIGLAQVSEPEVLRHFVRLSQKNYSIDGGIFPLGSCTMKHNPRLNEKLARLPGFAELHPMQDPDLCQGALALMKELEHWLSTLSGLPAVTLNPAAGAQGELAGMMVIRKAHEEKGNPRKVVLVPDSAHGTNPATASICGYSIKTIPSTSKGTMDVETFKRELNEDVAAVMLTNPNTCGMFEKDVQEIARLIHGIGGYFYCDGANFNAIVGKVSPAKLGVDVMHFNLHKTFSTPHGGGGPGSGPIAVTDELKPHLPLPWIRQDGDRFYFITENDHSIGRLKAFQGQFGMFVRALTYMKSHGGDGLKQVAEDAVLNANYVLSQLKDLYHVPFEGHCMHECLLSDKLQKEKGVTTLDIAKAMIEYGIHPMTTYFPLVVQGSMLIEPTETEPKESVDRLIAVLRMVAERTASGDVQAIQQYPKSAPRRRLDEVKAAREPKLVADCD